VRGSFDDWRGVNGLLFVLMDGHVWRLWFNLSTPWGSQADFGGLEGMTRLTFRDLTEVYGFYPEFCSSDSEIGLSS
jgi:hypothetical protein